MRAFVFVSTFVTLATSAVAAPVNDREKRQIGTFDYIIIGVSVPRPSHFITEKMQHELNSHYFRVAQQD
jgi:hypothetical protein